MNWTNRFALAITIGVMHSLPATAQAPHSTPAKPKVEVKVKDRISSGSQPVTTVLTRIAEDMSTRLKGLTLNDQDRFWSLQKDIASRKKAGRRPAGTTQAEDFIKSPKYNSLLTGLKLHSGASICIEPVILLPKGIGSCTLVGTYIKAGLPSSLEMPHRHVGVLLRLFDDGSITFYGIRWDNGKRLSFVIPPNKVDDAYTLSHDRVLQNDCSGFFGDKAVSVTPY